MVQALWAWVDQHLPEDELYGGGRNGRPPVLLPKFADKNVLLPPEGKPDHAAGHALVVYDARNPELRDGGKAEQQWNQVVAASRTTRLLRCLNWIDEPKALIAARPGPRSLLSQPIRLPPALPPRALRPCSKTNGTFSAPFLRQHTQVIPVKE